MKERSLILFFAGLVFVSAGTRLVSSVQTPEQQEAEDATTEAGGQHLRIETDHGPIHLWRPVNYEPRTAGIVVYVHGYFTSVDQGWSDGHLATQFSDSGRNAVFIAVEAPRSSSEDVSWKSLADLLRTVQDSVAFPLPRGPLVVVGHSGAYRTVLFWLFEPRVQHVILLDGLYSGQSEFRSWLRPQPRTKPHTMVLVSIDTWRQSNRFARRIYGTARRRYVPARSSSFVPRETHARLLYLRSQYEHSEIVSSGKVIPVLLEISPLKPLPLERPQSAEGRGAP
jgi:hypothetical protein